MRARLKPCQMTHWKHSRWRPVARTRITNPKTDCHGGGVPMHATLVIYADKPRFWYESEHDFIWNVETKGELCEQLGASA